MRKTPEELRNLLGAHHGDNLVRTTLGATTPKGVIAAENVVLTTNGYTNGLWPGLDKTFHPMVSVSLATPSLTADEQSTVLPGSVTISDSRSAIYYSR